jgi:hypothetical protein
MYRDALQNPPWWFVPKGDGSEDVAEIERLEKSYRRSLGALRRLGK